MSGERYDGAYYEKLYGKEVEFRSRWAVRFYARIAARSLRRIGGKRVLEVGCGHGYLLAELSRRFEAWGLEISEHALKECGRVAPRARCVLGDIEKGLPEGLAGQAFDLVVAKYVFEHLKEPGRAMTLLGGLLRPGGLLFYAVPNTDSPGRRWKGPGWYAYQDPSHVSLLPTAEWLRLTEEAGFAVRRVFSDGLWDLPYFRRVPRLLQLPLLFPTAAACLTGGEFLPARCGENLLVIAERR